MSKKANPSTIGAFIITGLALGIGGILVFSSAKFFGKTEEYILYFDTSVKGLNPGAPVKFRGVTVGEVREILIRHSQRANDVHIPVIISVDESLVSKKTDRTIAMSDPAALQRMIDQGLRGILQAQSFVTGILYVELDVLPHSPPPSFHEVGRDYKEIPTVPTQFQALFDRLSEIDFKTTMEQVNSVLARLDERLGELKMGEISDGATNLLASLNQITHSPDLTNSLASVHETLTEYRHLSEALRARVDPLAERASETLQDSEKTLAELRLTLQILRDTLAPQAPLRRDLAAAMNEFTEAARSINGLADFLTRHPDALLRGRRLEESKP